LTWREGSQVRRREVELKGSVPGPLGVVPPKAKVAGGAARALGMAKGMQDRRERSHWGMAREGANPREEPRKVTDCTVTL